jgi:cytochrome c
MKKIITSIILSLITIGFISGASAQERGTKEETQGIVKAAIAYQKANGKDKTLAEANNAVGKFRNKDLYVIAFDLEGKSLAHGNPKMVGKNLLDWRDVNGLYITKEYITIAKSEAKSGWLKYDWQNSITRKIETKESYVEFYEGIIWVCSYSL